MSSGDFYVQTKDLCVGYHGKVLLKEIEIGVRRGEILTLIGPNGAGKTTILKSMIRQLALLGGVVFIDGRDASLLGGNEFARELSVVLTERIQTELMTCRDVVSTGRYPYTGKLGVLSEEDKRITEESMELVQVEELADRDFRQISDGQKQRVLLARALCQKPQVLVLDEPTSFLDIRYKLEFLSILQRLTRQQGLTVILSLHELDLAQRVSDRIACVKGDGIDRFGTPEEIFSGGYIEELYHLPAGTYDEESASAELPQPDGKPEVFVLCGCGTGAPVFRKLQREGTPFIAGILWENDRDYPAACALAAEVISEKAFCPVSEETLRRAKEAVRSCERFLCTLQPEQLTGLARPLREVYDLAVGYGCSESIPGGYRNEEAF